MKRISPVAMTLVVLTTLLLDQAAGVSQTETPTTEDGMVGSPTPQVLIGQPPEWEPLPEVCRPDDVRDAVLEFVDAFNRGDQEQVAALFRPDVLDADGTPDWNDQYRNLGWFSIIGADDETSGFAQNAEDARSVTATRHGRGERWTLLQLFMGGYWWEGGVNISFDIRREADDIPTTIVGGKGALDCDDGTIHTWNMGGPEVLPDYLFEPGATPAPAVGLASDPEGS